MRLLHSKYIEYKIRKYITIECCLHAFSGHFNGILKIESPFECCYVISIAILSAYQVIANRLNEKNRHTFQKIYTQIKWLTVFLLCTHETYCITYSESKFIYCI